VLLDGRRGAEQAAATVVNRPVDAASDCVVSGANKLRRPGEQRHPAQDVEVGVGDGAVHFLDALCRFLHHGL
jgi:hypothetical protein